MIKIQKAPKSDNKLKKSAKPGKKVEKKGMNYTATRVISEIPILTMQASEELISSRAALTAAASDGQNLQAQILRTAR